MSRLLAALLSTVAFFLAASSLPITGVEGLPATGLSVQRRQVNSNSVNGNYRVHCQTAEQGSCSYYSSCIEPQIPCGTNGFVLSYAIKRCHSIKQLKPRCNGDDCISLNAYRWIHTSEQCFQDKISELLVTFRGRLSDPHTCLDWERKAIAIMNSCYDVVSSSGISLATLSNGDLTTLVEAVRVGTGYYDNVVNDGIPRKVMPTRPELATALISHPLKHRTIICIKGAKYLREKTEVQASPEDYVGAVRYMLNLAGTKDLYYGGEEAGETGRCRANQPNSINVLMYQYHLVTWFTSDNTHEDMGAPSIMYPTPAGAHFSGKMYELTSLNNDTGKSPRVLTQCGDGQRQATETCDYSFDNYKSCTLECEVREDYDCNMGRMNSSQCVKEECGDGLRTRGEECDDGNREDGDGCSSSCAVETATHTCSQIYNRTSSCTPLAEADKEEPAAPAKLLSSSSSTVLAEESANHRTLDIITNAGSKLPAQSFIIIFITLSLVFLSVTSLR